MAEIIDNVREKLDWLADKILDWLSGSSKSRLGEVKAKVPDLRKIIEDSMSQDVPQSGPSCDRH